MKYHIPALALLVILIMAFTGEPPEERFIQENFIFSGKQLSRLLALADKSDTLYPRTIDRNGQVILTDKYEWTSGFFAGALWYAYEGSGDPDLKKSAVKWTGSLESLKDFRKHHDLGFMMYCSYGNAYRLTGNNSYKAILIEAARSLSTRFSEKTGSIKSWEAFGSWDGKSRYDFPVIIDNMMNLELLFFASRETGDPYFKRIAIRHAENVMKNQVRDDYSCYHVVCYDAETGAVLARETGQGYANNSTWSRGQAWGIYGFTMTYRETGDPRFLLTATNMANYYLDHQNLPSDKVPYWDFNANQTGYTPSVKSHAKETPTNYRDASAAAITASALLELSTMKGVNHKKYRDAAIAMLHALSSPVYRAEPGENGGFILKHGVGSIAHHVEIDVPLIYADYYYLEALNRYREIIHKNETSQQTVYSNK